MAQTGALLTNVDHTLREDYAPEIEVAYRTSMVLGDLVEAEVATESPFGGKSLRMNVPVDTDRNWAVQAVDEDAVLGDADHVIGTTMTPSLACYNGSIKLSETSLVATENNPRAYLSALTREVRGMVETNRLRLAMAYHGKGDGVLAVMSGADLAAATTVTCSNALGVVLLDRNMYVDIYDAAGNLDAAGIRITSVNRSAKTFTTGSAVTVSVASGGSIYLKGDKGKTHCMGLLGIIDDGTNVSTLQGINNRSTTNNWFSGTLVDAGAAALTELIIQQAFDEAEQNAVGRHKINVLLSDYLSRRYGWKLLLTNKQRIVDSKKGVGGFEDIYYLFAGREVLWRADRMSYPGYIHGIATSALVQGWAPKVGGRWLDRGNGIMKMEWTSTGRKANWIGDYMTYHGLFAKNCLNHFRLYNFGAPA